MDLVNTGKVAGLTTKSNTRYRIPDTTNTTSKKMVLVIVVINIIFRVEEDVFSDIDKFFVTSFNLTFSNIICKSGTDFVLFW
jgi:hypothetical protein